VVTVGVWTSLDAFSLPALFGVAAIGNGLGAIIVWRAIGGRRSPAPASDA
jgi:hypothetical protein